MNQTWCKVVIIYFWLGMLCVIQPNLALAAISLEGIQVYQKNLNLSQEHKQKLAADIYRFHNADNLWDELRHEFVLPHYENNYQVQEQIQWFVNHQDFLLNSAARAGPFLYYILQQVRKRHLPAEFVLLPIMESAYNPFASSCVGAAGIWQMMPATASGFGIKQNWWYDGRRDVVASTRAALDYLAYLGSFFRGNWLLGMAAYDTGEGNVISAMRKNIRDGKDTEYWSLPLAQETRVYIPRLLALATIISHPDIYQVPFPPISNAPYLAQIDVGSQIDLKHAAELAGLSLANLKHLNPGYNHLVTDPSGPFKLVLPIENVEQFTENLARSPLYKRWICYKTKRHDTWLSIAKRFNTTATLLKKANPTLASKLRPGKRLVIPHSRPELAKAILAAEPPEIVPTRIAKETNDALLFKKTEPTIAIAKSLETFRNNKYTIQAGDTLYMVRNRDNLQKIASRFHVTEETLTIINHLNPDSHLTPGDKLIIPTHFAENNSTQKFELTSEDTLYKVSKGEDIAKIAKKFHTSPSEIRLANLLTDNTLQVGDEIIIPAHVG